jgi:hypothetical protein
MGAFGLHQANLRFRGPEGKTITMLCLSWAEDASLGSVFRSAGRRLRREMADGIGFWLLGRTRMETVAEG